MDLLTPRFPMQQYTPAIHTEAVHCQRVERPRQTKIGTEVAHVTRDSDTTFKVNRSRFNLQGAGDIVAASRTAC